MRIIRCGNRKTDCAYWDLCGQEFGGQRVGDRAAIYVILLEWRRLNPDRKLIVLDNPNFQTNEVEDLAKHISAEWMFSGIADEIWLSSHIQPFGENLYTKTLWQSDRSCNVVPSIKPPPLTRKINLPKDYICICPLHDCFYAMWRNFEKQFWLDLIEALKPLPIVVIGKEYLQTDIMESLTIANNSKLYIGGESGVSHWQGVFGTNSIIIDRDNGRKDWDSYVKGYHKNKLINWTPDEIDIKKIKHSYADT